ncbi:MAG: transglycosylase SLT domain-containing protein [Sulfurovum sp.]|nr:transglycosylase SLT domain-containing protein [Sulfurovum sp.]
MFFRFIIIALVFLVANPLEAKKFTYWKVHNMPKSVEKDYYIWRLLSQSTTTSTEAKNIIKEAMSLNKKLRVAYKQRTGENPPAVNSKRDVTPDSIWKRRSIANKHFEQGLKLLQRKKPKLAATNFYVAKKNYIQKHQKDKALFWLYLSTKNTAYLTELRKSYHPNIYTLMAADTVKGAYPKTITQRIRRKKISGFDIKNPIDWAKAKEKMKRSSNASIERLAKKYAAQESIGVYTFLKAKASEYRKSYFPMPYRDVMKKMSPQRQALIYAIARQESRFVPASVSRSFALGMMQFMPFLIKDIAKRKRQKMDLDDMFDPYKAIEYADYHLNYLNKYLKHPLFVAYAYNAGIGFTKKHITNKKNFRKGPYEPYMSMETMKNVESREYGKKVLSNYVIYLNKLGVPTRIFPLLKTLATPHKTDKFR